MFRLTGFFSHTQRETPPEEERVRLLHFPLFFWGGEKEFIQLHF